MIEQYQAGARTLILCDFDGTVSTKDTVNRLLREHLTDPRWRYHVKRYMLGEIGSKAVYEAVGPLMSMTRERLVNFVREHAALDPSFPTFLDWTKRHGVDVKIVSDGFDATIEALFEKHKIDGIEIFANKLVFHEDAKVEMSSPYHNPDCGVCGTCKLGVLRRFRDRYDTIILVGDGESDRHAAEEADAVIALNDLFVYCARQGIPSVRAEGFHEIPWLLSRDIEAVTFDLDGTLIDSIDSIAESFNHMFLNLGYPAMTVHELVKHTSVSLLDFVKSFLKPEETNLGITVFRDYYDKIYLEKSRMIPGAIETVKSLNSTVVQGVVTNKRGVYARSMARHFGFANAMARIIGAEDGFKAKPSGEMFDEFLLSQGAKRHNTIYVGDSPIDIEAAASAGIDAFVVTSPLFSAEDLALHKPRRVLKRITELPTALRPLIGPPRCKPPLP